MKTITIRNAAVAFLLCTSLALSAGEQQATGNTDDASLSNLTLGNFFTDGWGETWVKRSRAEGAPDMALLRVQTNFLVRLARTDFYFERMTGGDKTRDVEFLQEWVEYAFNRRFQLALIGNYEWANARAGSGADGAGGGALARVQLIDTPAASYALNVRVAVPNGGIGEKVTTSSFALAGWHDLTPLGFKRAGIYWHVQEETFAGPHSRGAKQNDLTYDVSIAKTWTSPDAELGNFSTFAEFYAKTDLDGEKSGKTVATLTPGFRFTLARRHVLICGVDVPLTQPRPFEEICRITYIYNF
jgi:hypothetical protein